MDCIDVPAKKKDNVVVKTRSNFAIDSASKLHYITQKEKDETMRKRKK